MSADLLISLAGSCAVAETHGLQDGVLPIFLLDAQHGLLEFFLPGVGSVLFSPRAISRPVRPFTSSPFSREGVRNRDVRSLRASRCNLSNRYSPLCRIRGNKPTAELRSMPRKALGDLCLRIR